MKLKVVGKQVRVGVESEDRGCVAEHRLHRCDWRASRAPQPVDRRVVQLAETAVPLPAVAFADGLLLFAQAGRRCYWSV
jgi:hypothetical protein